MAVTIDVPFAVQSGESGSLQNSAETLVNMYAEPTPGARKGLIRRQRVGTVRALANSGLKRGIEYLYGTYYVVIGANFYSFDGSSLTLLGVLNTSAGRVSMIVDDNANVMLSDGNEAYHWDGSTFAVISTPTAVDTLAFMNGYGIYNVPNAGQFYVTNLNDFTTVDSLDFATAESAPDDLLRVFVDHSELWLFGADTTEVWSPSSGSFPFAPLSNARIERGCAAKWSPAKDDNTTFWLGDDLVFYRADGYRPVRFSTHAVERKVEALDAADIAAAEAFIYTSEGHKFYTISFGEALTLQYNIATGFWNECQSYEQNRWEIMGPVNTRSDYYLTGTGIVTLSRDVNTDEDGIMRRGGISAPGYAQGKRIAVRSVFLDAEVGRVSPGGSADVMMRFAPDAETFGNERTRSLGDTGKYTNRAVWRNLGAGRKPVLEFFVSDDVDFNVMGVEVDMGVS